MWRPVRAVLPVLACLAAWVPTPAAAQGVECLDPGNRLTNCGFDTSISGWEHFMGAIAYQPGDGFPQPGSLEATPAGPVPREQSQWVQYQDLAPLAALARYEVGIDVRLISGSGGPAA